MTGSKLALTTSKLIVFELWTELDWALIVIGYIPGDAELVELIVATTVWLEFILLAEKKIKK